MPPRKAGRRHILLTYRRVWDRWWKLILLLGIALGILWWLADSGENLHLKESNNIWILSSAIALIIVGAFGGIARKMGYVQARSAHILLATPFFRLRISYQRVKGVRPADIGQLFPPNSQKSGQRQFLMPFYGMTAVALDLKGYPLSPTLLRLFFPKQIFIPGGSGFVLLVKDWMGLSAELDSYKGAWQDQRRRKKKPDLYSRTR